MSPEPQRTEEWLLKRDAARLLGVTERQIDRHAAAGRVRSRRDPRLPHQTAAPVLFSREDIAAIRAGNPNYYPVVEKRPVEAGGAQGEAPQAKSLAPASAASAGLVLERLAHLLVAARPDPRPWLGLKEAAEYSGLPLGFVRQLALRLADSGDAVNVRSAARPLWRIRRAALDGPLPGD